MKKIGQQLTTPNGPAAPLRKGQSPNAQKLNTRDALAPRARRQGANNRGPDLDGPSLEPVKRIRQTLSVPTRAGGPEMLGTRGNRAFTPRPNNAQRTSTRGQ